MYRKNRYLDERLYSHMRMYKDNSVHDDTMHSIVLKRVMEK